jgi:hypothetical protein
MFFIVQAPGGQALHSLEQNLTNRTKEGQVFFVKWPSLKWSKQLLSYRLLAFAHLGLIL